MTTIKSPKALTHDEKKAADAAFAGHPFKKEWSASARGVYDGIVNALPHDVNVSGVIPFAIEESTGADSTQIEPLQPQEFPDPGQIGKQEIVENSMMAPAVRDREAAIQAGSLIDVTSTALQLGISFPVTITRPLWEVGIVTNQSLPEEDQTSRLRDILLAFRLRLANVTTVSPLLDFPVLLALPPNRVPQPVPLFALIQPDPTHEVSVTLLLPSEVSLSITSLN